MKILLATSPVIEQTSFSTLEKTPPLGLGYLISVLRNSGHKVVFRDLYLNSTSISEIGSILAGQSIDLFAVSMNTICYAGGIALLKIAQKLREETKWSGKIVVGGPHPSVFPESIPEFVDYIVKGEGEEKICQIANGEHFSRIIDGIKVQDMDNLPFIPYEEFISLPYDFRNAWINKNSVLTLNTSRGCPFSCQFCSVSSIWGNRYRYQSAVRIIEEILRLKKDFNAQGIYFREDNFTLNRKRIQEFCGEMLSRHIDLPWICETRANTLTEDMVKLMGMAGCRGFYIGAESGSQRVLDYMRKGITLEQVENVINWSRKAGIRCYLSFVLGVPTETDEERYETFLFAHRLKPYSFGTGVFTGIPFSSFYWQLIQDDNYAKITSNGMIYQKNHNDLVDRFVGGEDYKIPVGVEDTANVMLPVLMKKMGKEHSKNAAITTLVLIIKKYCKGLVDKILDIKNKLGNPDLFIINCSGDDDVVLELTKLNHKYPFTIRTVHPTQEIDMLNNVLQTRSEYLLFAEFDENIAAETLHDFQRELMNNVSGVFRSDGVRKPTLVNSLIELRSWFDFGKQIDRRVWGCSNYYFRQIGGVDSIFGTAYLWDFIAKLVRYKPIRVFPSVIIGTECSNADTTFVFQALQLRFENNLLGLSTLCHSRRSDQRQIGKKEEAVVNYFFGRAKLRARKFRLARSHFFHAFKQYSSLKYLIFWCATFLPPSSYSFFSSLINRIKRI
ncbi:MAG: radical SAM protein [Syntrophorhabdaceae bacterium]|nr:radical SAM protein [Syntrophorhabdaceae bacterium]